MMLVLFLSVACCLQVAAQTDYNQLSAAGLKSYVDRALVRANQELSSNGHLNFYMMGDASKVTGSWVNIDVRLKNTNCNKQTQHRHRPECPFRRVGRLEVVCRVCGPAGQPTFIDCVRIRSQQTRFTTWDQNCIPPRGGGRPGAISVLIAEATATP